MLTALSVSWGPSLSQMRYLFPRKHVARWLLLLKHGNALKAAPKSGAAAGQGFPFWILSRICGMVPAFSTPRKAGPPASTSWEVFHYSCKEHMWSKHFDTFKFALFSFVACIVLATNPLPISSHLLPFGHLWLVVVSSGVACAGLSTGMRIGTLIRDGTEV